MEQHVRYGWLHCSRAPPENADAAYSKEIGEEKWKSPIFPVLVSSKVGHVKGITERLRISRASIAYDMKNLHVSQQS